MFRSNEFDTRLNPFLDQLNTLPQVGVVQRGERSSPSNRGERSSPLNSNVSSNVPLVSLNKESSALSNENLGVRSNVDSISTQTTHIPIIASKLSTNGKQTQMNTASKENKHEKEASSTSLVGSTEFSCPDGNELSSALVLYNPQHIKSTPASTKEPPPSSDSPPPLRTTTSELLSSPVDSTKKTSSSNPIAEPERVSYATGESTHLLKSNVELLHQLITFPEPCGQIAVPPILASKSHPSDAPGNILPPVSDKLISVSEDAPGNILHLVSDKLSVSEDSPRNISPPVPDKALVQNPSSPASPAHTQFSESTLEYLAQTSNRDSADFAPRSLSESPDPALPSELPDESFEVTDQRVEAPLPSSDSEHPANQPIPVSTPVPQPSESNIASSNPSIKPTPQSYHSASSPSVLLSNRDSTLLTPTPQLLPDNNNPKTLPQICPKNPLIRMIDANVPPIGDMASTSIHNRPKKRLVIEDSDDNSTPSNVFPVALASTAAAIPPPAAVGTPTTNPAPTAAISGTMNPPRSPVVSTSESTSTTRPHNVNDEMVDETHHGSGVCGWPDPDGKITAAQIRPILKENGIHYKMADPKAVLLAKYKLLFSNRQGNTPRYEFRQHDLAEVTSSTTIANPQSVEVPSAADLCVSAGEPGPLIILHSTNDVQPNLPCPGSEPNPNATNIPNLIDMETSSAMSVHPLSPRIA
ncbi:hypothetical protein PCANC_12432 [Puccinia coronata f. sp. avenae]|uniref:Uncharacterized protein n=1 Tax=Puccinia coronata f. sp. avenae TaxID=200324 RepID=A0A2N5VB67_9BASI|nr:hypothetical protein PCANC_12432 [Puccinia coronata f. sp. avenae]